jgi:hypothetical protein
MLLLLAVSHPICQIIKSIFLITEMHRSFRRLTLNLPSLGKSGLKISRIVLGTMSYGSSQWEEWVLDEEESLSLLEYAYKKGINTWDTVRKRFLLLQPPLISQETAKVDIWFYLLI